MRMRQLGHTDLRVAPLCLGGNTIGWTTDEAASFAVLDAYVEAGGNFIDTADAYSRWAPGNVGGESETILGNWMASRGNRSAIVMATKLGADIGKGDRRLSRTYITSAVEDSLRRLRTDYIDLYQAHYDDLDTPQEETHAAFDALVRQGKVRALGVSNFEADRIASARAITEQNGYAHYEVYQPSYSLMDRQRYESEFEPFILEHGMSVIPYWPLAAGFLTGKYRDGQPLPNSARADGVKSKYMNERGFAVLGELDRIAAAHGATVAEVALAWVLARPSITAPIASATSPAQVAELMKAIDVQLDPADIAALDAVSAP